MKQRHIVEIIDFGDLPVFRQATTYPCILVIANKPPGPTFRAAVIKTLEFSDLPAHVAQYHHTVRRDDLDDAGWSLAHQNAQDLFDKIRSTGIPLGEYIDGKIYRGVLTGLNEAFVIDDATREQLIAQDPNSAEVIKPFLAGRDIKRYAPPETGKYLILFPKGFTGQKFSGIKGHWDWLQKEYHTIAAHLAPFKEKAEKRYDKGDFWWELRTCDYYAEFEKPKIMLPDISLRGNFALDKEGDKYCANTAYIISNAESYLLGILNSSLITFFYKNLSSTYRGGYLRFIYQYLMVLPIRVINVDDPADTARHDRLAGLVDQMLELNKKLAESKIPQAKDVLKRQITAIDGQIDQLVYQLYDLTDEEIRIIEESANP
jgi:hypothetical protein